MDSIFLMHGQEDSWLMTHEQSLNGIWDIVARSSVAEQYTGMDQQLIARVLIP